MVIGVRDRFVNRLSFRIIFLMVIMFLFLGFGLYVLVLKSASEFEDALIEEQLEWVSRRISNIIDEEYHRMLISGYAGDEKLVRLSKGEALVQIKDFVESRKFAAAVFSETEERSILSMGITDDVIWKIMGTQPENQVVDLNLDGAHRYVYQFRFEPWQWQIIFSQEVTGFSVLLSRVRTAYALAAGALFLSAIVFYLFLNKQIGRPIAEIIKSLSGEKPLRYRGIKEFEFLSDTIHRMMYTLDEDARWIDSLLSTMGALIIVTDPEGRIVLLNRTCEKITGFKSSEIKGKCFWEVLIPRNLAEDFSSSFDRILEQKEPYSFESPLLTAAGREIVVLWNNTVIMSTEDEVGWFIATGTDITDRKYAEDQLKSSLDEKDVLLKEIHHRVKSNFQVISSLMNFQAQHITDKNLMEVYRASQNRVNSMALIHQDLYNSKSLTQVNFREYIGELARNLFSAYGIKDNKVILDIRADHLGLVVDTAIPCGLITNELLSNALKHAFPGERKGRIRMDFTMLPEDGYCLEVTDDGVGLPLDFDPAGTGTIGMRLVLLLVEQLGGTLKVQRNEGTTFIVTFQEYLEAGVRLD